MFVLMTVYTFAYDSLLNPCREPMSG
jgi:hypothetical protein